MEQAETGFLHSKVVMEDAGYPQDKEAQDEDDQDHWFTCHLPAHVHSNTYRHKEVEAGQVTQATH